MSIRYYRLFDLLARRGMKKTDLLHVAGISSPTLAKLSKGEVVTTEIIAKICSALNCQPGDVMEYIHDAEGNIAAKVPPGILSLDTDALKAVKDDA